MIFTKIKMMFTNQFRIHALYVINILTLLNVCESRGKELYLKGHLFHYFKPMYHLY